MCYNFYHVYILLYQTQEHNFLTCVYNILWFWQWMDNYTFSSLNCFFSSCLTAEAAVSLTLARFMAKACRSLCLWLCDQEALKQLYTHLRTSMGWDGMGAFCCTPHRGRCQQEGIGSWRNNIRAQSHSCGSSRAATVSKGCAGPPLLSSILCLWSVQHSAPPCPGETKGAKFGPYPWSWKPWHRELLVEGLLCCDPEIRWRLSRRSSTAIHFFHLVSFL